MRRAPENHYLMWGNVQRKSDDNGNE
jgi:hypothetical protein